MSGPDDFDSILAQQVADGEAACRRWVKQNGEAEALSLLGMLTRMHNSDSVSAVLISSFAIYGLLLTLRDCRPSDLPPAPPPAP